jgi:hypothetical protein
MPPTSRTFKATIISDDQSTMTGIEVPFDPKPVFGKVRVPVTVAINGHTYRSTIAAMAGRWWLPLRRSNREAAGVATGDSVTVTIALDEQPREVEAPSDLLKALRAAGVLAAWKALSFSHQREHVEAIEEAKKPDTRARRIARCVEMIGVRSG